jgi:hypothetical protein
MDAIEHKRRELDNQLKSAGINVGIAFGIQLFEDFRSRGWFTIEDFSPWGTGIFPVKVPAYQKTHFVFPTWDLPVDGFVVGRDR